MSMIINGGSCFKFIAYCKSRIDDKNKINLCLGSRVCSVMIFDKKKKKTKKYLNVCRYSQYQLGEPYDCAYTARVILVVTGYTLITQITYRRRRRPRCYATRAAG